MVRGEEGESFYMVVRDMVWDNGWDCKGGMVVLKCSEVVKWWECVINIEKGYGGEEKVKGVWGGESIYNKEVGK